MNPLTTASSGIAGFDNIINFLRMGDNVVWQVDEISDYKNFAVPFVQNAIKENRRIVYIRFAKHPPIVPENFNIPVYELDMSSGFEGFTSHLHKIIKEEGRDVYYVFDCLSDLLSAWATDLMIGNFFMITCPYLFELNTIAYFALLRNYHSFKTIARIRDTTQLLLDVYNIKSKIYIHPLKVWNRYTPTMFLPHLGDKDRFTPLKNSVDAAKLFSYLSRKGIENATRNLDYWDRLFLKVGEMIENKVSGNEEFEMIQQICKIMIGRDDRVINLFSKYFSLSDLLQIKSRLIGTGFIGGKAVGMLLARNILQKDTSEDWQQLLEPHDSFYIGSDVFYSYIVQNGWWKMRMEQKTEAGYFDTAHILKDKLLHGEFPEEIREQFIQMLEYFGQSPIIVRSSSLLEDSFGNAFAGKYESFFLVNQGTPDERYAQFVEAVRQIYASTMNDDALAYRLQRGLAFMDEQMALLVQRVSGSYHQKYFFPDLAGVAISYNTFVWKENMDPKAGMLRLVYGLGTRAVNRVENDYPRIVALDMPLLKPHSGMDNTRLFSQHEVDLLNIKENKLETIPFFRLIKEETQLKLDLIAARDYETTQRIRDSGSHDEAWIITFDELFTKTNYTALMQKILKILENKYNYPVDMEFTANFTQDNALQINVLQCRPLQTQGNYKKIDIPADIAENKIIFQTEGNFMGGSINQPIKRIIYVEPQKYGDLNLSQKYDVARLIGKINRQIQDKNTLPALLLGPGRWGSTTPSLGVPISFSEINKIAVLVEVAHTIAGLMPELSFGTHFFQDLVETGIFYAAIFPDKNNVIYNIEQLKNNQNLVGQLVPDMKSYEETVKVYDFNDDIPLLLADLTSQKLVLYFKEAEE